jgi:hypothetical protein
MTPERLRRIRAVSQITGGMVRLHNASGALMFTVAFHAPARRSDHDARLTTVALRHGRFSASTRLRRPRRARRTIRARIPRGDSSRLWPGAWARAPSRSSSRAQVAAGGGLR